MAYPDRLLADDEEVVLNLRPHWKVLVVPVLTLLVICALLGFGLAVMPEGDYRDLGRIAVVVVAALLLLWRVVLPFLRWRTTRFIITTHRVLIRSGILARQGRDIPLTRINDVHFDHSVVDRVLRCGSLVIESAGERGQVTLADVPRVEEVQRTLYRLVESDDARRRRTEHDVDRDGEI